MSFETWHLNLVNLSLFLSEILQIYPPQTKQKITSVIFLALAI